MKSYSWIWRLMVCSFHTQDFPCELSKVFQSSLFTEYLCVPASGVEKKVLKFLVNRKITFLEDNWRHKLHMHLPKYIVVRFKIQPSHHLIVKDKNINTRTMYEICSKINNKDSRTTSMKLFQCLYCQHWTYCTH